MVLLTVVGNCCKIMLQTLCLCDPSPDSVGSRPKGNCALIVTHCCITIIKGRVPGCFYVETTLFETTMFTSRYKGLAHP